jgi:N-acyl-D-aspartate/D-glutamate deacylase
MPKTHLHHVGTVSWRAVLAALAFFAACQPSPPAFDVVVRGGQVLDGTGAESRRADVGLEGDRIAAIGDLSGQRAATDIDATGMTVAPGFIDVQGQSGTTLLVDGHGESHLRQGITSEIIGEGGSPAFWTAETVDRDSLDALGISFDWSGFNGYFDTLSRRGVALNVGTLVPATMVRRQIVGLENRDPTADEMARMQAMVGEAMKNGAFGLSSALIYPPGSFAKTPELVALAAVASRHRGVYVTHVRGESFNLFNALDEAVRIGREARIPVVIFHLKVAARQNWGRMGEVIGKLTEANRSGVSVQATMYPYAAGGTGLAASLPLWVQEGGREKMLERLKDPATRTRARREIETTIDGWENLILGSTFEGIQIASVPREADRSVVGKRIAHIAAERGQEPWDVFFQLLLDTGGRVGALYHMMSEEDVKTGLQWSSVSIGTDAAAIRAEGPLAQGSPHPRAYGTFPRILGKYVRDERALTLPEAVRRMTSLAAAQFGIAERGTIREGYFADLVVFDPNTVEDTATFEKPHQYPIGIHYVIVNGVPVLNRGGLTGAKPGRALYGRGRAGMSEFAGPIASGVNGGQDFSLATSTSGQLATRDVHGFDGPRVADVVERIRVQDHQVGVGALLDRAELARLAVASRRVARGGHERLHRRQAGPYHHLQLQVLEEALEAARRAGIGAERDAHALIHKGLQVLLGHFQTDLVLLPLLPALAVANLCVTGGISELLWDVGADAADEEGILDPRRRGIVDEGRDLAREGGAVAGVAGLEVACELGVHGHVADAVRDEVAACLRERLRVGQIVDVRGQPQSPLVRAGQRRAPRGLGHLLA